MGSWFWLAGGVSAVLAFSRGSVGEPLGHARAPVDRAISVALAGACAHLGWVMVHVSEIVGHGGACAVWAWALDVTSGASMLFAPLGPCLWRRVRGHGLTQLGDDMRALAVGLAVARIGCVVSGCCAGVVVPGLGAVPIAAISAASMAMLGWFVRSEGRGPTALGGLALIRGAAEPLRAPSAHGGDDAWVGAMVAVWSCVALWWAWRWRDTARQKSSPSSKPSRTPLVEAPRPMAPMPPTALCCSARRSFGVPSCWMRPRGGGVRRMRNTPWRWPSRS